MVKFENGLKSCSKCEEMKPLSAFNKWSGYTNGYYPSCKACKKISKDAYREKHPEKHRAWSKLNYLRNREKIIKKTTEYTKNHPEIRRKIMLKHQYGISESIYKTMEINQDGKCAICGLKPEKHVLFVDHCHATGKVRGLLCRKCNAVLGMCDDNVSILQSSINYLRRY